MPRKNPVAQRELEIALRIKAVRLATRLKRVAFADILKVDSSLLSNIEHGRAPVRYGLGQRVCLWFNVCQRWLATGRLPKAFCLPVGEGLEVGIDPQMLFSKAYDETIGPLVEIELKEIENTGLKEPIEDIDKAVKWNGIVIDPRMGTSDWLAFYQARRNAFVLAWLPMELRGAYDAAMKEAGQRFMSDHATEVGRLRAEAAKIDVDMDYGIRNSSDMKSEWPGLLKKVVALTKPKGMKARLASDLGVPAPRVSEWVKGRGVPTTEVALKLRRMIFEDGWPAKREG